MHTGNLQLFALKRSTNLGFEVKVKPKPIEGVEYDFPNEFPKRPLKELITDNVLARIFPQSEEKGINLNDPVGLDGAVYAYPFWQVFLRNGDHHERVKLSKAISSSKDGELIIPDILQKLEENNISVEQLVAFPSRGINKDSVFIWSDSSNIHVDNIRIPEDQNFAFTSPEGVEPVADGVIRFLTSDPSETVHSKFFSFGKTMMEIPDSQDEKPWTHSPGIATDYNLRMKEQTDAENVSVKVAYGGGVYRIVERGDKIGVSIWDTIKGEFSTPITVDEKLGEEPSVFIFGSYIGIISEFEFSKERSDIPIPDHIPNKILLSLYGLNSKIFKYQLESSAAQELAEEPALRSFSLQVVRDAGRIRRMSGAIRSKYKTIVSYLDKYPSVALTVPALFIGAKEDAIMVIIFETNSGKLLIIENPSLPKKHPKKPQGPVEPKFRTLIT